MDEEKMIQVYDMIGCNSFGHGNDKQLTEWGNSEERIRQIKIEAVKSRLEWYKTGIEAYKLLNEICGGQNVL